MLESVKSSVKSFSMKNVEWRILAEKYNEYKASKNHELALQSCYLRLQICKELVNEEDYLGEPSLLGDTGEILLETDLKGAMKVAREGLV